MKGLDLHPKDHSIQLFTDASNKGWGAHLEQSSTQGLWSPQEKAEMCALLWRIMTWYHHSHITLKARHIPGCLNVMADLLSKSNQVQLTEWSLHPSVRNRSEKSESINR